MWSQIALKCLCTSTTKVKDSSVDVQEAERLDTGQDKKKLRAKGSSLGNRQT